MVNNERYVIAWVRGKLESPGPLRTAADAYAQHKGPTTAGESDAIARVANYLHVDRPDIGRQAKGELADP